MTIRISRRTLARAGACAFTLALTLAPLLAPAPRGGQAFASKSEEMAVPGASSDPACVAQPAGCAR